MEKEDFFSQVYAVTKLIPPGRVTTYGAIARFLGAKSSARMVGWAMNASHQDPTIPAHRVVNRNGELSGKIHFGDPFAMQRLLENEGIQVKDDTIVDFDRLFWDPESSIA